MKEFKNKVAVVTGAASGIGRGIAEYCVKEGMKVVISDIEEGVLTNTAKELQDAGATVLSMKTDVSKEGDIQSLADKTLKTFGEVNLLFNNAGIIAGNKNTWEYTRADWEWTINVNLWSVIHGVRIFLPIMLAQDIEGHIVNTASVAGFNIGPNSSPYTVSKHGVMVISEGLYHELAAMKSKIGVTVLCPFFVNTRIMDAERNRPAEFQNPSEQIDPEVEARKKEVLKNLSGGLSPSQFAEKVFKAIREKQFYVFTHQERFKESVRNRMEAILQGTNPVIREFLR